MNRTQENVLLVVLGCIALLLLGWVGMRLTQDQGVAVAEGSPTILAGVSVSEGSPDMTPVPTDMPERQTQISVLNDEMQDAIVSYQTATPSPLQGCTPIKVTIGAGATEDVTIDTPKSLWATDFGVPVTVMNGFTNTYINVIFEAEAYGLPDFNLMNMYKEVVDVNMFVLPPGTYTIGILSTTIDGVELHVDEQPTTRTLYLCERFQD